MLLGYKIAGVTSVVLLAIIGWLSYENVTLSRDLALKQNEVDKLTSNVVTLETANETSNETIDKLITLSQQQAGLIERYGERNNEVVTKANRLENEIDRLRNTEAVQALQIPFERGNAATVRVGDLMQSIAGTRTDSESKDDSSNP